MSGVTDIDPGHSVSVTVSVTYRPTYDVRRTRRLWLLRIGVGLLWAVLGVVSLLVGQMPWIGVGYLTLGVIYLAIAVVSGRAYIQVDDSGVQWRGLARRNHIAWHAVDHVVVDERDTRYGGAVRITFHKKDGSATRVPDDVLVGLEGGADADRPEHLLDAVTTSAEAAAVNVRHTAPGDPLVM